MKEEIELKIIELIGLLDYLLAIDNFPAYHQIKDKYSKLLIILKSRKNIQEIKNGDFDIIQSVYRLIGEAPPKDSFLGNYISNKMQGIYNIQKEIVKD